MHLVSKKTATKVPGSVNLESVYICTSEPYEVTKVSAQMLKATGGWKFEQRDAVDTTNCKKEVFILEKSFPSSMSH